MPDPKRPSTYRRRPYDPQKHCGFAKDRSVEFITAKIEKGQARIDAIDAQLAGAEPSVIEKTRIKRIGRRVAFYRQELEKIQKYGPDDRPCMYVKGQGTTHPGTGHCKNHCECKGKQNYHFENKLTYSPRKTKLRVRGLMEQMAVANHDLMDMEPVLLALHAKTKDFMEQKGDDLDPESIKSITILMEQIRKTVDSMQDKKFKTMMSMDVFNLINAKMGMVVEEFVKDPEILEKILTKWSMIQVETGSKRTQELMAQNREA